MTTHKAQRSVDPVCSSLSSLRSSLRKQQMTNLDCVVKPKPLIVKTTKRNLGLKCKKNGWVRKSSFIEKKNKNNNNNICLYPSQVAHPASAYPGLHCMKRLAWDTSRPSYPLAFHLASLKIHWYPFILLDGERHWGI